jgi:hypothetical protein
VPHWVRQISANDKKCYLLLWIFLGSCLFLFFSYKLQQVEDAFKEEKFLDIFLNPTRIFNNDESSSNFLQRLEKF